MELGRTRKEKRLVCVFLFFLSSKDVIKIPNPPVGVLQPPHCHLLHSKKKNVEQHRFLSLTIFFTTTEIFLWPICATISVVYSVSAVLLPAH